MSISKIFDISASAMAAQAQRLNVVASNLANADSATGPDGKAYRAKQVVFSTTPVGSDAAATEGVNGVKVSQVIADPSPMREVFDPKNPLANDKGFVTMPNVSVVEEMVNMLSASRAYQNNIEVMNTAKSLLVKTLSLGQ